MIKKYKLLVTALLTTSILLFGCTSGQEIREIYNQSIDTKERHEKKRLRQEIIKLAPDSAYGYFSRAWFLQENNSTDHKKIITLYGKAIDLEPALSTAYYNRGIAYKKLDRNNEAIEDYSEAIRINPEYIDAYINRGVAYSSMENYDKAIENYNQALEMDPSIANAYYNRGIAYMSSDYQKAIHDFDKAIELGDKRFLVYYNRGITYEWMDDYSHAINDYNKAIEINPSYGYTYKHLRNVKALLNE